MCGDTGVACSARWRISGIYANRVTIELMKTRPRKASTAERFTIVDSVVNSASVQHGVIKAILSNHH
jgi:hypothetical protein